MNIHEYQAKAVLREFGVPVPRGHAAFSVEEAVKAAKDLGAPVVVVKAQIHAGGRGKAGGVKVVKSTEDVRKEAERLIGSILVTHQTGPHGKQVNRLYIEEGSAIDREFYLSALVDRETSRIAFVASTAGGMDIEEVARTHPEQIMTFSVDPATGIMPHHGRLLAQTLGLRDDLAKQAAAVVTKLYAAFVAKDMSLLEINPLVVTKGNELICLDAKIGFDDNALFRHPDIVALRDLSEEDEKEIEASNTSSTTSRSTAPSAAWSTAPGWPWRRWISSGSTARRRPTFSTSAAVPARRRLRPPSRSSLPIPR